MSWEDIVKKELTESTPDEIVMAYKPRVLQLLQKGVSDFENANDKNTLVMTLKNLEKLCSVLQQQLGK